MRTIGYLTMIWSLGGSFITILYVIWDFLIKAFKIEKQDKNGCEENINRYFLALSKFDSVEDVTEYIYEFLSDYDNPNEFKFILTAEATLWGFIKLLIDWPHVLKLYQLIVHPIIEESYENEMRLISQKKQLPK